MKQELLLRSRTPKETQNHLVSVLPFFKYQLRGNYSDELAAACLLFSALLGV